jgi:hypothetical protein
MPRHRKALDAYRGDANNIKEGSGNEQELVIQPNNAPEPSSPTLAATSVSAKSVSTNRALNLTH